MSHGTWEWLLVCLHMTLFGGAHGGARCSLHNSRIWDAVRPLAADHIKDLMVPYQYTPNFTSFSQANSRRLEMGIIVSCLTGIVTCFGECIIGIIGAIVDCLECVISGTPTLLRFPEHL